ncbi:MAG: hypothetical protein LBT59_14800 [Clostridiales bacterium]|jgi:uncharacterized protein YukE|nr:hypothetical protein [Clostridiales bacterium]
MADIIFRYDEMNAAVSTVNGYAESYKAAADEYINKLNEAINAWEGESKIKFSNLITGSLKTHIGTTIPEMVKTLADILKANADQMLEADQAVAQSIPETL